MNRISEQTLRSSVDSAAAGFDLDAAARRLADRAEDEGVLDVAYATVDSPFGRLLVAATDRGVVKLSLPNYDPEAALGQIAAGVSPRVLESPQRLDAVRRELDGSPTVLRFSGLRECVKRLTGAKRWSAHCQALNDQIVDYLRTCLGAERSGASCALVVC